jgi:hypothetical protein
MNKLEQQTNYANQIRCQFRDVFNFVPTGGTIDVTTFNNIPNGIYEMKINGKVDKVKVINREVRFGNFN